MSQQVKKLDKNVSHFRLFSVCLGFNIPSFSVLFSNAKFTTFNNIKPLLSNNIKSSMGMIYHYYNICKLLCSSDALLDLII